MATVNLTFTVLRPDGGDKRSTGGKEQGEQNAIISIYGTYDGLKNIRIGEFSLAETRLMLGSGNATFTQIKDWCTSPTEENYEETPMSISTTMLLPDFINWMKSYPNHLFSGAFPTT